MKKVFFMIICVMISVNMFAGNVEIIDIRTGNFVYYRSNDPKYAERVDTIWTISVNGYEASIDSWDGYGYYTRKWIDDLTGAEHVNVIPLSLPENMSGVTIRFDYLKKIDSTHVLVALGSHWSSKKDGSCVFIYNQETGETNYNVNPTDYEDIPVHIRFDHSRRTAGYHFSVVHKGDIHKLGLLWW